MTKSEAIKILSDVGDINRCCEEDAEALDMAIKALEQTVRISKRLNELDLADASQKDFENMFYLQSVQEIKEEMWKMYCFAEDVAYTLNL